MWSLATRRQVTDRYFYPWKLADGRLLGDLRVDALTRQHVVGLLDWMRALDDRGQPRTSMAVREHIRSPLRRFYRSMIEDHGRQHRTRLPT